MKKDTSLPVGGRVSFLCLRYSDQLLAYYSPSACLKALDNWSGQDVGLSPHLVPSRRLMTSCASIPLTRLLIPDVLPAHPPYEFYVSNFISVKFYVNETRTDSGWFVIHIYYLLIMFLHSFTRFGINRQKIC